MAIQAILRKIILSVIRVGGTGVIALMAAVAIAGETLELIVNVAIDALYSTMGAPEFKSLARDNVVELGALPTKIGVACLTGSWKTERGVGRVDRGVEILYMAGIAFGRRARILVYMAMGTIGSGVLPSQCKNPRMLEICDIPAGCYRLVALLALARESGELVVGIY